MACHELFALLKFMACHELFALLKFMACHEPERSEWFMVPHSGRPSQLAKNRRPCVFVEEYQQYFDYSTISLASLINLTKFIGGRTMGGIPAFMVTFDTFSRM